MPCPFLIGFMVFCFSIVISYITCNETFVQGNLLGFGSLFEFGSWICFLFLYYLELLQKVEDEKKKAGNENKNITVLDILFNKTSGSNNNSYY